MFESIRRVLFGQKGINVYIDGAKPKWYASELKRILREHGVQLQWLKIVPDKRSAGLRLADAMAGLVCYRFDHKVAPEVEDLYKKLLKKQNPD